MKKLFLLLSAVFTICSTTALGQGYVWPIAGKAAGTDILYRPQEYIGNELVFEELFIGGKEGDVVVSPVSGTVFITGVVYKQDLEHIQSCSFDPARTFDQNIKVADFGRGSNPRYYSGQIGIRLADGNKVYISGIAGNRKVKTGQKISAGDTLGIIGYSYKGIKAPSLQVVVNDAKGICKDPMSPFGLKSTFVEAKALTREESLPADKIREDLEVLKTAYCTLYPSFGKSISKAEFAEYMDSLIQSVNGSVNVVKDFRMMLRGVLSKVPDSHQFLYPDPVKTEKTVDWVPGDFLIACNDTVRLLMAEPAFRKYEGKIVTEVNGRPAAEYARGVYKYINNYDGKVESLRQEEGVMFGRFGLFMNPGSDKNSAHKLVFADGSTVTIPFKTKNQYSPNEEYMRLYKWYRLNSMNNFEDVFETRTLNDSTAYLGIKTFEILDEQVEQIGEFLNNCKAKNLIVDVRNNGGGSSEVLNKLLSYFADAPMDRQKGGYFKVKVKGQVPVLDYSQNYGSVDMFPDYVPGPLGYFKADTLETCAIIKPDSKIHYGGRVYVLTNGHSYSAATLFPAVLVRNGRAVSVGRETGTTYHSMTAYKFADIRMPNTYQTIRIPLVQCVFDTSVNDRFPESRGLLPDYPLPLTYKEIFCGADGKTDVMLDYALSLISKGKYL